MPDDGVLEEVAELDFMGASDLQQPIGRSKADDWHLPEDPLMIDFICFVYIAGGFHVMHNLSKGLPEVLSEWPDIVKQLSQLCRLRRRWSRARLLETCFSTPPASLFRKEYTSFNSAVYEGRWASSMEATTELLPLA